MKLNKFQKVFAKTYAQGIYDEPDLDPNHMGDGLAEFILVELADDGDELMDREVAISRMEVAAEQLQEVLEALRNAE